MPCTVVEDLFPLLQFRRHAAATVPTRDQGNEGEFVAHRSRVVVLAAFEDLFDPSPRVTRCQWPVNGLVHNIVPFELGHMDSLAEDLLKHVAVDFFTAHQEVGIPGDP